MHVKGYDPRSTDPVSVAFTSAPALISFCAMENAFALHARCKAVLPSYAEITFLLISCTKFLVDITLTHLGAFTSTSFLESKRSTNSSSLLRHAIIKGDFPCVCRLFNVITSEYFAFVTIRTKTDPEMLAPPSRSSRTISKLRRLHA
jgi:hypothetical protein